MPPTARSDTRSALIRAAERLFAEKGLGTVSVKDITKAAGARNPSAVHYHFGNVEALIKEVFALRYRGIEGKRLELLAAVDEADRDARLVALMEAAVTPLLETCLEEEGRLYVRFCVQFASDPRFDPDALVEAVGLESLGVLRAKLAGCVDHVPPEVLAARLRQGVNISLLQAAAYARQLEAGDAPPLGEVVREASATLAGYLTA